MEMLSNDDMAPLTPEAREAMLDVILAWAAYDALTGQWLANAYGLRLDDSTLLIGNMDTRTKLDRLKRIYEHHGMKSAAAGVDHLRKKHLQIVPVRNHIAHSICRGTLKGHPDTVIFTPFKASKDTRGLMSAQEYNVAELRLAATFAKAIAHELTLFNAQQKMPTGARPPEPPVFFQGRRPNPQTKDE